MKCDYITKKPYFWITVAIISSLVFIILAGCSQEHGTPPSTLQPKIEPSPIDFEPVAGQSLVRFDSGNFAGSGNCAMCHTNLTDASGVNVSIDEQWRSTMHANASIDPYFRAKLSAEIKNAPHLQEVIEDVCATCHTPMARTQALADGMNSLLLGQGFFNEANELHNAGKDGISCTLCHQIQPTGLGQEETFVGQYIIDTSATAPDRILFSPFMEQDQSMMMASTGFKPVYGEHIRESGVCATCHTLITPTLNAQGEIVGTFVEQSPFLEFLHGSHSQDKSCQTCHMPAAAGGVKTANRPPNLEEKMPFSQHYFVGGNVQMLEILRDNADELEVSASTQFFNDTIKRTLDQLNNRTANIEITDYNLNNDSLSVTVKVENQAGHKVPSAFPSRRVWIHFQVLDSNGMVIFESGRFNEDGSITGNIADEEIYAFEPHYDIITSQNQVQIYESILQTVEGDVTHTLLRADTYAKDNRLLPAGFNKETADANIKVWGEAANDDNFIGGSDQVTYKVETADFKGPFTIKVDLLYQSLAYSSIHSLLAVDTPEVKAFKEYFEKSDKTPVLICSDTRNIS